MKWQPRITIDYSGNEIAIAPQDLINVRARFAPAFLRGGFVSADVQRVGSYWEDPENTSRYDGHSLVNVRGRFPVWRGLDLSFDDRVRADVIQQLMCNAAVDVTAF